MENMSDKRKELIAKTELAVNNFVKEWHQSNLDEENEWNLQDGSSERVSIEQYPAPQVYFITLDSTGRVVFGNKELKLKVNLNSIREKISDLKEELKEEIADITVKAELNKLMTLEKEILADLNKLNYKPAS